MNVVGPAKQEFLEFSDGSFWYKIVLSESLATPLLILHGGPGGFSWDFEKIAADRLAKYSSIILFDQRGCGRSTNRKSGHVYSTKNNIADIEDIRRCLNLERISVLGFSYGGQLALEYAVRHEHRIDKLILVAPSDDNWARIMANQIEAIKAISNESELAAISKLELSKVSSTTDLYSEIWACIGEETVNRLLFLENSFARHVGALWNDFGGVSNTEMAAAVFSECTLKNPSLIRRIKNLKNHTLVVVGKHDKNTGLDIAKEIVGALSNAKLQVFPFSAHFPYVEETDQFISVVGNFL